ncbi:MAG: hypothetical protein C4523_11275 [Myxococcales bacterium]|nr:MAG: hypothetical protein C4523_11275 [Myxococcales bacterium]
MRAFSFLLLILYLTVLSSAYADLCLDGLGSVAEGAPVGSHSHDVAGSDFPSASDCCDDDNPDSDHDCGSCLCLCHAVAVAPGKLRLNSPNFSQNSVEAIFSAVSIDLFRIERPPRLS